MVVDEDDEDANACSRKARKDRRCVCNNVDISTNNSGFDKAVNFTAAKPPQSRAVFTPNILCSKFASNSA